MEAAESMEHLINVRYDGGRAFRKKNTKISASQEEVFFGGPIS
jgi:hypothetical protein